MSIVHHRVTFLACAGTCLQQGRSSGKAALYYTLQQAVTSAYQLHTQTGANNGVLLQPSHSTWDPPQHLPVPLKQSDT